MQAQCFHLHHFDPPVYPLTILTLVYRTQMGTHLLALTLPSSLPSPSSHPHLTSPLSPSPSITLVTSSRHCCPSLSPSELLAHHLIILSCRSNGTMCELRMLCHHSCTLFFACPFPACTHRYTYLHCNWVWVWTVWVPLDLHTCPKIHTPHARAFTGNHHHYSRSFIEHFTTYLYPTLLVVVFSLCQ